MCNFWKYWITHNINPMNFVQMNSLSNGSPTHKFLDHHHRSTRIHGVAPARVNLNLRVTKTDSNLDEWTRNLFVQRTERFEQLWNMPV